MHVASTRPHADAAQLLVRRVASPGVQPLQAGRESCRPSAWCAQAQGQRRATVAARPVLGARHGVQATGVAKVDPNLPSEEVTCGL